MRVCLSNDGVPRYVLVHRLVGEAFIAQDTPEKNTIDHIDLNKKNNCFKNLRWLSLKENILEYYRKINQGEK